MKILLILGILAMLATGYFAWTNFEELKETRVEKDRLNSEIERLLGEIDSLDSEIRGEFTVLTGVEGERDETRVNLRDAERRLAGAIAQAQTLEDSLRAEEAKIARYEQELERLPPGLTIDNVRERLEEMRTTLAARTTEIENLDGEIATIEEGVERNQRSLDGYVARQAERRRAFDLNSTEGLITAINRDWGFAVVNLGENSGVSPDATFLVKRGNQPLGKLSVMAIEPGSTVCNIDFDSLQENVELQPGDRVILENLQR